MVCMWFVCGNIDVIPKPGWRLQVFLPGCVSMGLENRTILKGLNDDSSDPY